MVYHFFQGRKALSHALVIQRVIAVGDRLLDRGHLDGVKTGLGGQALGRRAQLDLVIFAGWRGLWLDIAWARLNRLGVVRAYRPCTCVLNWVRHIKSLLNSPYQ